MASPQSEHEDRTRVVCHLPLNNSAEEKAFKSIINYLEKQRRIKIGVDGYTYSDPNAFMGRWWSSSPTGWISDKIVLLLADFKIALTDPRNSLSEKIAELRETILQAYRNYNRPQDEVWLISFKVTRYT